MTKELNPARRKLREQIAQKVKFEHPEDRAAKGMFDRSVLFWKRVDKSGDCWIWCGFVTRDGYGKTEHRGRNYGTHVFALVLEGRGPAPGQVVRHKCNNPPCVRPDHLLVGTPADNVADRDATGNAPKGERNGRAKLTEAKVRLIRELWAAKKHTKRQIAEKLFTSFSAVSDIVTGKIWKHVV